jgi:hypothetical protein
MPPSRPRVEAFGTDFQSDERRGSFLPDLAPIASTRGRDGGIRTLFLVKQQTLDAKHLLNFVNERWFLSKRPMLPVIRNDLFENRVVVFVIHKVLFENCLVLSVMHKVLFERHALLFVMHKVLFEKN